MSDAKSIRSVRTTSTSGTEYVPLENTATSFVTDLLNSPEKSTIIQRIFSNDDSGNILSHVFTNPKTRSDVWAFFDSNTDWCLQQMEHYSDPQFMALGFMCKKRPAQVPLVLKKIGPLLVSKSSPLAVMARVDPKLIDSSYAPDIARHLASDEYVDVSLAVVVLAKLLSIKRTEIAQLLKTQCSDFTSPENTVTAFKVLAHLFSLDQQLASEIYHDLPEVPANFWSNKDVITSCLEMLNSAAIVKENRNSIVDKFPILSTAKDSHDKDIKTIASVVYAKLIASGTLTENPKALLKDLNTYSMLFENYIIEQVAPGTPESITHTTLLFNVLEAFAITSSLSEVRTRCDKQLMNRLATIVRSNDTAWVYGALCSIANLIEYPFKLTVEQRRVEDIKHKTGALAAFDVDSKLEPPQVLKIVEMFLDTSIVNYLSASAGKLSQKSREQVTRILQSLTGHQTADVRSRAAKQGATIVAVYLWVDDQTAISAEYKSIAASAVAKILTSVDPRDIFTHKFTPVAVIDPLKSQLNNKVSQRPNLDTFESLMALTNIASIENDQLNELIVNKCWAKIEDCLGSEYILIQKSVFQLICNLSYCDACARKLSEKSDRGDFLRTALGHGLQLDDIDAKLAAAGALAILCNHEDTPTLFGHNVTIMEQLILSLESDNDDLLLRVVTALHDIMLRSLKRNDDEAVEAVIYYGGVPRIDELLTRVSPNNRELAQIITKTVKLLVHFRVKAKIM